MLNPFRLAGAWLLAAFLGGSVAIGAPVAGVAMDALQRSSDSLERRLAEFEREYGHRRGLIGAEAAESRFEEAVFSYLVEDFEQAAIVFYTLVEAEALVRPGLARDAEWYLAECLFEDGNYLTSVEAYQRIIDHGVRHPFFIEAVRRQLEAYGLLKDTPGFYRVYNAYIVTAIVPTTDAVRYSMAKSFYYKGDLTRAKVLFSEVGKDSKWFTRARYFLGAILVSEGELGQAARHFQLVSEYMPADQAEGYLGYGGIQEYARMRAVETEVQELARLALGRVYYEQGKFEDAQRYYQDIRAESTFFTEQLYELVWTYVRQEKWLDAINQIEIFLIAYPEHHYAFRLRLLLGHLHMRREAYERALASYEQVVDTFGPIQEHLKKIEQSSTRPKDFFAAIVVSDAVEEVDALLPGFAVDLLIEDEAIGRAVDVRRELNSQVDDLDESRDLVDQIAPVLHKGTEGIGTFRQGREAIATVRSDGIKLRADIIALELTLLEERAPSGLQSSLIDLRERWEVLVGRAGQVRSIETAANDRVQAYTAQIREVQQSAFRSQQIGLDQVASLAALKRRIRENPGALTDAELQKVREQIVAVNRELDAAVGALERLQGEPIRRRVLGLVDTGVEVDTSAQRGLIAGDLDDLHKDVLTLRGRVSAAGLAGAWGQLDEMWKRARSADRRALSTLGKLERAEAQELTLMRRTLAQEMDSLVSLGQDVGSQDGQVERVSGSVTRAGIGRVEDAFNETVMGADRGIVDVYWAKKASVSSEIERLNEERGLRNQELDERFTLIRHRLGDAQSGDSE